MRGRRGESNIIDGRWLASRLPPGVELIDLLASDVDLNGRKGEPAHGCEGLHGAQESAVGSIHPTLSVLGLGERHPPSAVTLPAYWASCNPEGEPTRRGGLGEHRLRPGSGSARPVRRRSRKALRLSDAFVFVSPSFPAAQSISLADRPIVHHPLGDVRTSRCLETRCFLHSPRWC